MLLAAPAAPAEIYRCEDKGHVRFTDRPCDAQAEPVELRAPIIVPAEPHPDLLGDSDKKSAARRKARDAADAAWVKDYTARKAAEERIRHGRMTRTVVEGMKPDDVRRLHGEPDVVTKSRGGKTERETWRYTLDDGTQLHVTFTGGAVSAVRTRESKKP